MAFDYIAATKKIIGALKNENLIAFSDSLQNAMDSAATSTELLMGIRFCLSQMPLYSLSSETKNQIQTLMREIDEILQR